MRRLNDYLEKLAVTRKSVGIPNDKLRQADMVLLLGQLSRTWEKFPELRLGQLLSNSLPKGTDIFYVTDAKLIQLLKDFEAKS